MISFEEETQFLNMIDEYKINKDNMFVKIDNGKYIFGVKMADKSLDKIYMYNHFLQSILDLSNKTRESIVLAIDYCKKIKTKFNPFNNNLNADEYKCYYYLENALYRLEMLWDSLAQLYNLYSETNLDIDKIYYKSLFKNLFENKKDLFNIIKIYNYVFEPVSEDETNIDIGVHKYVYSLRNITTHRYSLSVSAMSNNVENFFHMREAEPYLLYKICFDYNKVMSFLSSISDKIFLENKEVIEKYANSLTDLYS